MLKESIRSFSPFSYLPPPHIPFAPFLAWDLRVAFWDSHWSKFKVPAFLLVSQCDHPTSSVVAGLQDGYLEIRGAAVILREGCPFSSPHFSPPDSHRLWPGGPEHTGETP